MKKPALLIVGLLSVAFISIYFIIPQNITAKCIKNVDCTDIIVSKFIIQKQAWAKWWPGKRDATDSNAFLYNGVKYILKNSTNSYMEVLIKTDSLEIDSKVDYLAAEEGATRVTWQAVKLSSLNPFTRINEFVRIKNQEKEMARVLAHFKQFIQKDINVYGINIKMSKVTDPVMIATNATSKTYPSTALIYSLINKLQGQIKANNATATNKPMLNINQTDKDEYQVMVAIPVSKEITPGTSSFTNRMLKGGNILETEVKGGRNTIDNAFMQMKNYTKDHRLIAPAMPFELIMTDRLAEKDTAKWVTKIYFPVF